MPRLLDNRVVGGQTDVTARTLDDVPVGYVLRVAEDGKNLDFGPPVGFTGSQGLVGSQGSLGYTGSQGPQGIQGVPGVSGDATLVGLYASLFTAPGSWTVPPGTQGVVITAIGGGGAAGFPFGGGTEEQPNPTPGAPGFDPVGWLVSASISPGQTISWTIGAGGRQETTPQGFADPSVQNGQPTVVNIPGIGSVAAYGGQGSVGFNPAPWALPPAGFANYYGVNGLFGWGIGGGGGQPYSGAGGRAILGNPSPAVHGRSGAVYLQWAQRT